MVQTPFPKYFSNQAIGLYLIVLISVNLVYINHLLPMVWWIFGLVEVCSFFYFSSYLSWRWMRFTPKKFEKKIFRTSLIIRCIYVVFIYFFYEKMTGIPFMFHSADEQFYEGMAKYGHYCLSNGQFNLLELFNEYAGGMAVSDAGYPIYLSFIYLLTNDSIIIARLIKALLSAFIVLFVYRIAQRNFGEKVGRIAAVFCMLMPNLIYYCGVHLKETEMIFLSTYFVERMDLNLRLDKVKPRQIALVVVIAIALFTLRTVLGAVAILAVITAIVFTSSRVTSMKKRIALILVGVVLMNMVINDTVVNEVNAIWENRVSNQSTSMQWRSTRVGGNEYAKYASAVVFAPLIFTIPFPTMVNIEGQDNTMLMNGSFFVKNILSFFVILTMFMLLFSGEWKKHVFIIAFMCGYLVIIAFSAFAQSERFHLPALPLEVIFAAYGVSTINFKQRRFFSGWIALIFVAIVAWNFIKMKGRGLI